jgi:hypothetical protein
VWVDGCGCADVGDVGVERFCVVPICVFGVQVPVYVSVYVPPGIHNLRVAWDLLGLLIDFHNINISITRDRGRKGVLKVFDAV